MTQSHTPTPWQIIEGTITDENGNQILPIVRNRLNFKNKVADKQFIVRACNAFDDLVKLVECLIDNDPSETISDAGHTVLELWRHEAIKTLAKIKVQS